MKLSLFWRSILDIVFPLREGAIPVAAVTKESLAPYFAVTRDFKNDWIAVLPYRNALVRTGIHALKYKRQKQFGTLFGTLLADALLEDVSDWISFGNGEPLLVIPIPLSPHRLTERGYNQAELIGAAFAKNSSSLLLRTDILSKIKDTRSQTKQEDRLSRIENLRGAFGVVYKDTLRGKTIVLIDDVITTGATVGEAKSTLLAAGARKVYTVAVAH